MTSVRVSRPDEQALAETVFISQLPEGTCVAANEGNVCSLPPAQIIKWGWGFCAENIESLENLLTNAQVELWVNNTLVPDVLIYQRNEIYEREENSHCHTWNIKLSNWQSGSSVRLENKANVPGADFGLQNNIFIINVQ
jgi:hypothetical protein